MAAAASTRHGYLPFEDSPAFEQGLASALAEAEWVRGRCERLLPSAEAYSALLDPREPPPLGNQGMATLGGLLGAPLLTGLVNAAGGGGGGSPGDDKPPLPTLEGLLADALLAVGTPRQGERDGDEEITGPLAASVGVPLLGPVADVLRGIGQLREELAKKAEDELCGRIESFLCEDLKSVNLAKTAFERRRAECDDARSEYLSMGARADPEAVNEAAEALEDAKQALEAARERLSTALCSADGKRRHVLLDSVSGLVEQLTRFFHRGLAQLEGLDEHMGTIKAFTEDARSQGKARLEAHAAAMCEWRERATTDIDGSGGGGAQPTTAAASAAAGMSRSNTGGQNLGRSSDRLIRETLEKGKKQAEETGSVLGVHVIKQGYLSKRSKSMGGQWGRHFFVLDSRGQLTYHLSPQEALASLPTPGVGGAGRPQVEDAYDSPERGLLLPLAQKGVKSLGIFANSAMNFLAGPAGAPALQAHSLLASPEQKRRGRAGTVDLLVSAIKMDLDAAGRDTQRNFCFRVISPTRELVLQAESEGERREWVDALQGVIAELLSSNARSRLQENLGGRALPADELKGVPGNDRCADCGAPDPDWASINLGVLICQPCAGAHRQLGTHVSKVKSLVLDTDMWTPLMMGVMKAGGNAAANEVLAGALAEEAAASKGGNTAGSGGESEGEEEEGEVTMEDEVAGIVSGVIASALASAGEPLPPPTSTPPAVAGSAPGPSSASSAQAGGASPSPEDPPSTGGSGSSRRSARRKLELGSPGVGGGGEGPRTPLAAFGVAAASSRGSTPARGGGGGGEAPLVVEEGMSLEERFDRIRAKYADRAFVSEDLREAACGEALVAAAESLDVGMLVQLLAVGAGGGEGAAEHLQGALVGACEAGEGGLVTAQVLLLNGAVPDAAAKAAAEGAGCEAGAEGGLLALLQEKVDRY